MHEPTISFSIHEDKEKEMKEILTAVYDACLLYTSGREVNQYGISSEDLGAKMPRTVCLPSFESISEYAMSHAQPGDLIITLGCGDINKCAKMMVNA